MDTSKEAVERLAATCETANRIMLSGAFYGKAADTLRALLAERDAAYRQAVMLADALWRNHYSDLAPQWRPLDTLDGVISQIDNMSAGIGARAAERDRMREAVSSLLDRLAEWVNEHMTDDNARDWDGHVEPAIARVSAALKGNGNDR